jgi:hypothetical protein
VRTGAILTHRRRAARLTVVATVSALAMLGLSAASASAAPTIKSSATTYTVTLREGMTFVRVLKILGQTPGKPGYFTAVMANGQRATVPDVLKGRVLSAMKYDALQPGTIPITPLNSTSCGYKCVTDFIPGNCGSSDITLTIKVGGHPIRTITGFRVITPEVYYNWRAGRSGPNYAPFWKTWSGFSSSNVWNSPPWDSSSNYPDGTWSGAVDPYNSWAELDNGQFCYSGGPAASGYV